MLLCDSHSNAIRWQPGERLHHLFEATCDRLAATGQSDRPAVATPSGDYSFASLDQLANQIARYLKAEGVKPGDRVGVLFDKSIFAYAGLLAILKLNAAYVPFDASFPSERIGFIADDAEITTIVSLACFEEKLGALNRHLICLDRSMPEIEVQAPARLGADEIRDADDQLAYIIYTSGSTGNPKGVAIEHPSICNFVRVAGEVYGIQQDDRMFQGLTIAFDYSIEEIFVPLIIGATLVPGPSDTSLLGSDLAQFLTDNDITAMCCVPTLLATVEEDIPGLRWLMVSGEACPDDLVRKWSRPGRQMLNAYGPTETTVTCTLGQLVPGKPVTIGKPLPTYSIVILEEDKNVLVPDGEVGEVAIAGICVARGYVNRPDLTEKVFINDFIPLDNNPSGRIYRSGDKGRINSEGELEYLGRIDTQVKVRGYRIELSEIETVLREYPGISQAVVDTYKENAGPPELVAYYTLAIGVSDVSRGDIAGFLRNRLPGYMVPPYMEELDAIPMLPSAKADRKKLPPPKSERQFSASTDYVAPETDTQEAVANALSAVLGLDRVSVEDNFFNDLGAHSLLMSQFAAKIKQTMAATSVSMRDIYQNPTVAGLAQFIDNKRTAPATPTRRPAVDLPPPYVASDVSYYLCGTLQFAFYVAYIALLVMILAQGTVWTLATDDWMVAYVRAATFAAGALTVLVGLSVALKWLVIGRYTSGRIPIWSLRYFAFWAVKQLIYTNPLVFFRATPLYNVYLRMLGAKIGPGAVLNPRFPPVCADLVTIGANTVIRKDALILGYRANRGYIEMSPVSIGDNVIIGEASVIDIGTTIGDGAQLGHTSSVHTGQTLEPAKHYYGSPSVETETSYDIVPPLPCGPMRRTGYCVLWLSSIIFVLVPAPFVILYQVFPALFGGSADLAKGAGNLDPLSWSITVTVMFVTQAAFAAFLVLGLVLVTFVPRLLAALIEKDRVYPLFGLHYYLVQFIGAMSNSYFYNAIFGDSSYITRYLTWVGYDLSNVKQTGSNFGIAQRHDVPTFCKIGSGTMVSDGLNMINVPMSSSSFRVSDVKIGEDNFLGNEMHFHCDAKIGENCLLASKVHVPIDGPIREDVGLLGSPPFEIPRNTVARNQFDATAGYAGKVAETGTKEQTQPGDGGLLSVFPVAVFILDGLDRLCDRRPF